MSLSSEAMYELFERHNDEYLKFDRIPAEDRRHERPDLCGMIRLAELIPVHGCPDIVQSASHDEVWLDGPEYGKDWPMTEADVIYLARCGVRWDSENDSLAMFV